MTLDELAKAAYEAARHGAEGLRGCDWDELHPDDAEHFRVTALAVAEKVLEAIEAEGIDDIRRHVAARKEM